MSSSSATPEDTIRRFQNHGLFGKSGHRRNWQLRQPATELDREHLRHDKHPSIEDKSSQVRRQSNSGQSRPLTLTSGLFNSERLRDTQVKPAVAIVSPIQKRASHQSAPSWGHFRCSLSFTSKDNRCSSIQANCGAAEVLQWTIQELDACASNVCRIKNPLW